MGKTVKVLLVLTLLVSITCFSLGVVSAQQAGMTIADLAKIVQTNMEELHINPVTQEYSDVQETMRLDAAGDKHKIVIKNTFPDLVITQGEEFKVDLLGDVSTKLDNLLSWSADLDTVYINIASVYNQNPSAKGLTAHIMLPKDRITELEVSSISGDVSLLELPGIERAAFSSKSGNITIDRAQVSTLNAYSVSGNISLNNTDEVTADLSSDSGDITVFAQTLSGAVNTKSGRIQLQFRDLNDKLVLDNLSGNMAVIYLGNNISYDLASKSGWITVNKQDFQDQSAGAIGAGDHLLTAKSVSGSIYFELKQ